VRRPRGYAQGAVDYIPMPVVPGNPAGEVRVFVDLYRMTQQVKKQAEERIALAEERSKRAAAEEATRRAAFLAEVSRALAGLPSTRRGPPGALARQGFPFHGRPGRGDAARGGGDPGLADGTGVGGGRGRAAGPPADRRGGPDDELRAAVERALGRRPAGGARRVDRRVPAGRRGGRRHGPDGAVVPLRARGRTLGILTLGFGPSGRSPGPAELALAEDLASRAAIALDNARLYRSWSTRTGRRTSSCRCSPTSCGTR